MKKKTPYEIAKEKTEREVKEKEKKLKRFKFLLDEVIEHIKADFEYHDDTYVRELLLNIPEEKLLEFLPDEVQEKLIPPQSIQYIMEE